MEDPVVITAAVRTATGAYQGVFKDVAAQALGTAVIAATLTWSGMDPKDVGEVYLGNVLTAGLGQVPVRQAALFAGLPPSVPCSAISKVCGSAMLTVMLAHDLLRAGTLTSVIAGGMENMSRAPLLLGLNAGLTKRVCAIICCWIACWMPAPARALPHSAGLRTPSL